MKPKASEAPGYTYKAARLERRAVKMREYNLTHGIGCKSIARAIEQRTVNRT